MISFPVFELFKHEFDIWFHYHSDCPKEAFQCNDGTCLSKGSVCNGRWECPDGSDESRCYKGKEPAK